MESGQISHKMSRHKCATAARVDATSGRRRNPGVEVAESQPINTGTCKPVRTVPPTDAHIRLGLPASASSYSVSPVNCPRKFGFQRPKGEQSAPGGAKAEN